MTRFTVQKIRDDQTLYLKVLGREDLPEGPTYYAKWVVTPDEATAFKTAITAERTYRGWQHLYYKPLDVVIAEKSEITP